MENTWDFRLKTTTVRYVIHHKDVFKEMKMIWFPKKRVEKVSLKIIILRQGKLLKSTKWKDRGGEITKKLPFLCNMILMNITGVITIVTLWTIVILHTVDSCSFSSSAHRGQSWWWCVCELDLHPAAHLSRYCFL